MLEKLMQKLKELKKEKENELMDFSLETVQGFFDMEDQNKWLKYNSVTQEQLNRTERFEEQFYSIIKKLYVPDYHIKNV